RHGGPDAGPAEAHRGAGRLRSDQVSQRADPRDGARRHAGGDLAGDPGGRRARRFEPDAAGRLRGLRPALPGELLVEPPQPAGPRRVGRHRARARRRRGRQALARRRPHAREAEQLHGLRGRRRPPRRAGLHRARPAGDRGRQRGRSAHRRRAEPASRSLRGGRATRAVRGRHQHDAGRVAAAHRRRVRGVGQPERPCLLRRDEVLRSLCQPRDAPVPRAARADVAQRQPGDVLGARQVRGAAARTLAPDPAALQDQHGGGSRRSVGALRLPPRDRVRLRVDPRPPPEGRMKVARLEHLHADAGKGVLDFLKLTTDDGVVGWSEYNETFGGAGVTAAIDGLAPLVIGRDPRARKANIFLFDDGPPRPHMPGFARPSPEVPSLNAERRVIGALRDELAAFREGAGRDVDILVDLNFNFRTEGFVKVARAMEPFDLFWVEIDSFDPAALHEIRSRIDIPLASLESQYTRRGYRKFIKRQAVDVAIVDAPWNGVAESLKIAAMADTYEVNIAP